MNVPTIVEVEVEVEVAVVVPMVVLSSFLAKSFLAKILFCFDSVIWLPRCFGYEKEAEEKEKEEAEGERKWMALFKDLIFWIFFTEFLEIFLLFLANLKEFLEFMLLTRLSNFLVEVVVVLVAVAEAEAEAVTRFNSSRQVVDLSKVK